jgi:hypothetical protein
MGHTCAIHSRDEAAIRRFGQSVPAFRVCVNTSAVHGSIGYSTNLFPAMTLGCGAPGGNITSDNIGPQHLLNVKRIAWEARPVEHRTVPAAQRLAGHAPLAQRASSETTATDGAPGAAPAVARPPCVSGDAGAARSAAGARLPPASEIAAQVAGRVFAAAAGVESSAPLASSQPAEPAAESPAPSSGSQPPPAVAPFVSESDVRLALARREKIVIGPRTIVTPSARDLGTAHQVFIEASGI